MSKEAFNAGVSGGLFKPVGSAITSNQDALEVEGWCRRTFLNESYCLVVSLGKRKVSFGLNDILIGSCVQAIGVNGDISEDTVVFFRTRMKIGKGLKRLRFSLEAEGKASFALGNRNLYQKNKIEHSPTSEVVSEEAGDETQYESWLRNEEPKLRSANRAESDEIPFPQRVSWIVELNNQSDEQSLRDTLLSVWACGCVESNILLVADPESDGSVFKLLKNYGEMPGVKLVPAQQLNQVVDEAASNDSWICFLNEGDVVEPSLGPDFCRFIGNQPETELFYTDSDCQSVSGGFDNAQIRPAWNRDLLHSYPYIGNRFLLRSRVFKRLGGLRTECELNKWDLLLRFSQKCERNQVGRLCGIYFHVKTPTADRFGTNSLSEGVEILTNHYRNLGCNVEVSAQTNGVGWRIRYELPKVLPKVSLLIPTRDRLSILKTTVDTILDQTDYPNYEILVLDNESQEPETLAYFEDIKKRGCRIIPCPGAFNYSQINNRGSMEADGDILGFLNNDLEVIDGGWLTEMVSHACREGVGAVGAKLLYPDGTLQHTGVLLGVGHVAAHAHRLFENDSATGPMRAHLIGNYSAVTAACLLVKNEVFKQVGGFDDVKLAITNNDVDLCIKIRQAGYRNLYTPYAVLFHHESASRGPEDTAEKLERYRKEVDYMWERWSDILMEDPAYNLLLTRFKEDFSLAESSELVNYVPGKIF